MPGPFKIFWSSYRSKTARLAWRKSTKNFLEVSFRVPFPIQVGLIAIVVPPTSMEHFRTILSMIIVISIIRRDRLPAVVSERVLIVALASWFWIGLNVSVESICMLSLRGPNSASNSSWRFEISFWTWRLEISFALMIFRFDLGKVFEF